MVLTANGLRVDVSQYHLPSHSKLGKVDDVIYEFIGFSFSEFSIHTHSSHTLPFIHLIIIYRRAHFILISSLRLHHPKFLVNLSHYITTS